MTSSRPPYPPQIPGYEFLSLLGRGGYADVFLYRESATQRLVAVKVLHESALTRQVRDRFESELRLMGQLSNHPAIVTLYNQGISGDGRPFLVMEHCPGTNLGKRFRTERMTVAEVLRIGVEIAGAVETAHISGILHLDIKPANILVTEYGHPVLADFGIARLRDAGLEQVAGVSVPWAPPEIFGETATTDQASDVWGLAAMIYSLLGGRSPFEVRGGDNSEAALIDRICHAPVIATGRNDIPPSLERVLMAGLAKSPRARIQSAAMFARMLQSEQVSMGFAETQLLVRAPAGTVPVHTEPEGPVSDGTQVSVRSVRPNASAPPRTSFSAPSPAQNVRHFSSPQPVRAPDPIDFTATRNRDQFVAEVPGAQSQRRTPWAVIASVLVIALIGGAIAVAVLGSPSTADAPEDLTTTLPTQSPRAVIPVVRNLVGIRASDGVEFSWENPDPESGDTYRWLPTQTGSNEQMSETASTSVVVPIATGRTCIAVALVRESGRSSSQTEACVS